MRIRLLYVYHKLTWQCESDIRVKYTGWGKKRGPQDCLMHFVRLANTLLKDGESARDNHVLACNFAKHLQFKKFFPPQTQQ